MRSVAVSLRQLSQQYNEGNLRRGDFLRIVNEQAAESVGSAMTVLTELTELRRDKTLDESTGRLIEGTVRLTVKTTFHRSERDPDSNDRTVVIESGPAGESGIEPAEFSDTIIRAGAVLRGRFVIDKVLGVGGMGTVYQGRDRIRVAARDQNPFVAIKVLNEGVRDRLDSFLALQREAARQQKLAHPNIATVYDFDRAGGTYFLTMELLEGTPLDHLIRAKLRPAGGLPLDEALPIIRDLASALSHAHQHDLIHSDFKPGNCFLTNDGRVKVLDFGIARAVRHSESDANTVFDGSSIGALTPAYASIEMLERRELAHPSDDVFALACVSYELLCGRHPFGKVPATTAEAEGLRMAPLPKLSRAQNRALAHALAFRREGRTPSVEAFIAEFEGPPRRKLNKRAMVAATVVAVLVGGAFVVERELERARTQRTLDDAASGVPARVARAAAAIVAREGLERQRLLADARIPLSSYYSERIRAHVRQEDFKGADALIAQARTLYPDSARIEAAAAFASQEQDRLFGELGDAFELALAEGRLAETDAEDDIPDLVRRIRAITDDGEILSPVRVENAYADAIERAIAAERFTAARGLLTTASKLQLDSIVLTDAADRLRAAEQTAAQEREIAALAAGVAALDATSEPGAFVAALPELRELHDRDPDHAALARVRHRAAPLLEAALRDRPQYLGLAGLSRFQDDYGPLLGLLGLDALAAKVDAAFAVGRTRIRELETAIRALAQNPDATAESTANAASLLAEWARLSPGDPGLQRARGILGDTYVRRIADARSAGQWARARELVALAQNLELNDEFADRLAHERRQLEEDETRSRRLAESERRAARMERLLGELESGLDRIDDAADVRRMFALRDELTALRVPESRLPDVEAAALPSLVAAARNAAAEEDGWEAALRQVDEAQALFPHAPELAAVRAEIADARERALQEARQARLAAARGQYEALLVEAPDPPTAAWAARVGESLAALEAVQSRGSTQLAEQRARAEKLLVSGIAGLRRSRRFARAEALLASARTVLPGSADIEAEARRVAEERSAFEAIREREARIARTEALKQNFLANARAKQLERVKAGYATLREELSANDSFLEQQAPAAIAALYLELATEASAAGRPETALALVQEGLGLIGPSPRLLALRKELTSAAESVRASAQRPPAATTPTTAANINPTRLFGRWCGDEVTLVLSSKQLIFELPDGKLAYPVSRYESTPEVLSLYWSDRQTGELVTEFGKVADDFRTMVQLRGRPLSDATWREYGRRLRRCD